MGLGYGGEAQKDHKSKTQTHPSPLELKKRGRDFNLLLVVVSWRGGK